MEEAEAKLNQQNRLIKEFIEGFQDCEVKDEEFFDDCFKKTRWLSLHNKSLDCSVFPDSNYTHTFDILNFSDSKTLS